MANIFSGPIASRMRAAQTVESTPPKHAGKIRLGKLEQSRPNTARDLPLSSISTDEFPTTDLMCAIASALRDCDFFWSKTCCYNNDMIIIIITTINNNNNNTNTNRNKN